MSINRIDYKEAREYYIKGEGDEYPSLSTGTKYAVYILLKLRFNETDKILMKQIKSTNTSEPKLKASKAFQELEEAIVIKFYFYRSFN